MVRAANQSLRIERDIMLRHPGEKKLFYILFERIISNQQEFIGKKLLQMILVLITIS